jgi:hypothetical protein
MMKNELVKMLGYHLYTFRWDNKLTEKEMIELLLMLMETKQFKKEYGIEEEK